MDYSEQVLVIKVGSTLPKLRTKKGDFEDWILEGMGLDVGRTRVLDVRAGASLPDYRGIAGVVVTGSHDYVTDHRPWSERTAGWLVGLVERDIPVLGICYGHQLLAYALGGRVGDNPNGNEFGTLPIQLTPAAQDDPLLAGFSEPLHVQLSHTQSVLRLPLEARRLASSGMDINQAFVVGERAWGVQFHPEFDAEVVAAYIDADRDILVREGQEPDALIAGCTNTPAGRRILERFGALAMGVAARRAAAKV
jgi:GMP synthase (glutamine-hydrolysing)